MEETMCQQLEDRIATMDLQIEFEEKEIVYNQKCLNLAKGLRDKLINKLDALILEEICGQDS